MKSLLFALLILPLIAAAQEVTVTRDGDGNITLTNPAGQQQPTLDLEGERTDPLALDSPAEVEAGERVYSWIDENGVVHYSDQPQGAAGDVQTVDLSDQPLSSVEDTDLRETEEALIEELDQDPVERQIEEF